MVKKKKYSEKEYSWDTILHGSLAFCKMSCKQRPSLWTVFLRMFIVIVKRSLGRESMCMCPCRVEGRLLPSIIKIVSLKGKRQAGVPKPTVKDLGSLCLVFLCCDMSTCVLCIATMGKGPRSKHKTYVACLVVRNKILCL